MSCLSSKRHRNQSPNKFLEVNSFPVRQLCPKYFPSWVYNSNGNYIRHVTFEECTSNCSTKTNKMYMSRPVQTPLPSILNKKTFIISTMNQIYIWRIFCTLCREKRVLRNTLFFFIPLVASSEQTHLREFYTLLLLLEMQPVFIIETLPKNQQWYNSSQSSTHN